MMFWWLGRKLLKKQGRGPTRITTDKLRAFHVAIRTLGLTAQHIDNKLGIFVPRIRISQFGGENENSSVSNHRVRPNAS